LAVEQILPTIRANSGAIDIVRIPSPDGIETFWLEIQCCFESWRVMKA
jgi:hypothetical protein